MQNFKCIYGHKSTSICINPQCHENAFICRTCRKQQCFIKHNHDRQHILSLRTLEQYFQLLNRETQPNQQIYQRVLKQFKKLRQTIQEQIIQFQKYKNQIYNTPTEIIETKNKLFNGNFESIQSKDLYQYIQFCKKFKQMPDLKFNQYIEYEQKMSNIRSIQQKLFQSFKDLYHIPSIHNLRKIQIKWASANPNWKISQNTYKNTTDNNLVLVSKQLFIDGYFETQIDVKVNKNIHFGLTLKQSPLILNGHQNQLFPLEAEKNYTYHMDAYGRIYNQYQQIQANLLKGKNLGKYTRLKIIFDTNAGYIKWFNDNQFQWQLENLELKNGVYVVVSIDHQGQIKNI